MKLFTEQEAAALLRITEGTLARLRRLGKVGFVTVAGRRHRYTEDQLKAFVRANTTPPERNASSRSTHVVPDRTKGPGQSAALRLSVLRPGQQRSSGSSDTQRSFAQNSGTRPPNNHK